ncbi:MAG TPA: hypothetical protein PKW79_00225 [Rhabdochlamydiaceae bacterium]|nr:hypothetical protein [Rhabdochlamydiaceae bacterium]
MKFKSPQLAEEFSKTSVFLQDMAETLDAFSKMETGQEIIITRIKEHICGSSGVHEDNRAFDARNEFEGGRLYTDEQVKKMVSYMNTVYPRNDGKVTMIHHSFQGGPFHLHVQLATLTKAYETKPDKADPQKA